MSEPLTKLEELTALLAEERARRDEAELEQDMRAAEEAGEKPLLERLASPAFAI